MVAFSAYSLVMGWLISGYIRDLGIELNKVLRVALAWKCEPMAREYFVVNDPSSRCERGVMALL